MMRDGSALCITRRIAISAAFAALLCSPVAHADPVPAAPSDAEVISNDPVFEQRLKDLEVELRCLVCQNQTLADSNAALAGDLRRQVRLLAQNGRSDEEIRQYLEDRYGDFVLYKPRVRPVTWALWFGPFALVLVCAVILGRSILRRRLEDDTPEPDFAQRNEIDRLLD